MNATMAHGNNEVEDEYIWTVTLDKDNKEYVWNPTEIGGDKEEAEEDGKEKSKLGEDDQEDDEYDEDVHPAQKLLVKNAFLSLEAKDGQVNVVNIETLGYKGLEIKCPLVAMKAGTDYQRLVDQEFSSKVKLTLVHGQGPVQLVGTHSFDFSSFKDMNQTSFLEEDESEEEEGEEMEEEDQENGDAVKKNGVDKKRKAEAAEGETALKKEKKASPAKKANATSKA
ncbi:mitotic apparatus protein p62 [Lepeophtheirus salmonis]|uniref:mitotic apparatus protein p62 n=1 Tax=Lepeophtheirus salmonis TaxID=72036 RepID=UPI001AE15298|nr:mitotic apparatus protein p62-like [Lepeophtheirus salmonis]